MFVISTILTPFLVHSWGFDDFLEDCREAGVPRSIYGRLRTFHSYNKIRIGFKMTYRFVDNLVSTGTLRSLSGTDVVYRLWITLPLSFACIIPSIALLADTVSLSISKPLLGSG